MWNVSLWKYTHIVLNVKSTVKTVTMATEGKYCISGSSTAAEICSESDDVHRQSIVYLYHSSSEDEWWEEHPFSGSRRQPPSSTSTSSHLSSGDDRLTANTQGNYQQLSGTVHWFWLWTTVNYNPAFAEFQTSSIQLIVCTLKFQPVNTLLTSVWQFHWIYTAGGCHDDSSPSRPSQTVGLCCPLQEQWVEHEKRERVRTSWLEPDARHRTQSSAEAGSLLIRGKSSD